MEYKINHTINDKIIHISGGTGCFDLLFDTDKLEQSEYSVNDTYGRMLFTPLEEEALISDLLKYDNINMSFHIPK